jgi:hypothetical protein
MPELEEMFASNMATNGPPPAPPTGGIPPQYGGAGAPSMAMQPIAPPDIGASDVMPPANAAPVIPRMAQPQMAPLPPFPQRPGDDNPIIGNPASRPEDGVLKRMLMNFAYGASEAIKTKLGMPTEVELQQKKYADDVRQWQMAASARQQEFQNQNIIADNARQNAEFQFRMQQAHDAAQSASNKYEKRDPYTDSYTAAIAKGASPAEATAIARKDTQQADKSVDKQELYLRAAQGNPEAKEALRLMQQDEMAQRRANKDTSSADMRRSDLSYRFSEGQIAKLATPLEDQARRASNLTETLRLGNAVADAAALPELITVIAGGQGSGVRITDAELNRVAHGRSTWDDMKAIYQKWTTGQTLTPTQRAQMQELSDFVTKRIQGRLTALHIAQDQLSQSDDVNEHRRILAGVQKSFATSVEQNNPDAKATATGSNKVQWEKYLPNSKRVR